MLRLLDRYERGRNFGDSSKWARDIVVRFNSDEFPQAFAVEGYDEREAIIRGAIAGAARAGLRIVSLRGQDQHQPREFRLGATEVAAAYAFAELPPLIGFFADLRELADSLAATTSPWLSAFLVRLSNDAQQLRLPLLRIADRRRLRAEWPEIRDSLIAAAAIAAGADGSEVTISERLFEDRKRVSGLRHRVARLLREADPQWTSRAPDSHDEVLRAYGVSLGNNQEREPEVRCRGPWRLGRRLGGGGQGEVYLAQRLGDDERAFVLKEMKLPQRRPDRPIENAVERFGMEIRTLRSLEVAGVEGIVRVVDADDAPTDGGPPWLVMRHHRYSLHEHRRRYRGQLVQSLDLIAQVARTLTAIHATGHAHRDVKVRNIFFDDLAGRPILGDFGLAWQANAEDSITEAGDTLGPASWRPPEFRSGGERGDMRAADVYLLGGMLYELLASAEGRFEESERRSGFTHEHPRYNLAAQISDRRIPLVNELLRRMLARDPDARSAAADVATAVEHILDEPAH